jgi:RHS repeat-associated protein
VWSARGRLDSYLVANHCPTYQGASRCWRVWTTPGFQSYNTEAQGSPATWQGQLLQDKVDQAGTKDRRARVYDPFFTGSFTQSDPIGISGGLNTYGFANGDPLNYTDPFGLFDVTFGGASAQAYVRELQKRSTTFDKAVKALEANHNVLVNVSLGHVQGDNNPGLTESAVEYSRDHPTGLIKIDVTLDLGKVPGLNQATHDQGGVSVNDVVGHEI